MASAALRAYGEVLSDGDCHTRDGVGDSGSRHWMGEAKKDGFYEVKFHDRDGIAFDITSNGWTTG